MAIREEEDDPRYRNSPYGGEEDREQRTTTDTRNRTTKFPGFIGGSKGPDGNLFFGGGQALSNFRADRDDEAADAAADKAAQDALDEADRQTETPYGPKDGTHQAFDGDEVPNEWEQEDWADSAGGGTSPYNRYKVQGGNEVFFDPSGDGSTFFEPKLASSPELQREGERQKDAIGAKWEEIKRRPGDFMINPRAEKIKAVEQVFGRVVCTELMRQGLLSKELWRLDLEFTNKAVSDTTMNGYHKWAVPYVRLMRKYKLATHAIKPFVQWRAEEIAYLMGKREKGNFKGKLFRLFIEPLSFIVGLFCKAQNYMVLYQEKKYVWR